MKKSTKKVTGKKRVQTVAIEYLKSIVIALILAFCIKATVAEGYYIPTSSMEKTLMAGDYIVGNKFVYGIKIPFTDIRLPAISSPQRGDMVVFRPPHEPGTNYVKRLIGLPGDTIQIINKQVYINGELYLDDDFTQYLSDNILPLGTPVVDPYKEAYVKHGISNDGYRPYASFRDNSYKIIVPEGKYFMMGDNRDMSLDSRMWGFADQDQIRGKAMITLFSWDNKDENAPEINWKKPLTVAHNIGYNIIHFPDRMRWDRILHIPH